MRIRSPNTNENRKIRAAEIRFLSWEAGANILNSNEERSYRWKVTQKEFLTTEMKDDN